jgi:putative ABC transport system permease protein
VARSSRRRLLFPDLLIEACNGIAQRPVRTALTSIGIILGVGSFVAIIGLTATVGGQIDERFTALLATEVSVELADTDAHARFPADADRLAARIDGVVDAGVWWVVDDTGRIPVTGVPLPGAEPPGGVQVLGASPGLLRAIMPHVAQGRLFDEVHDDRQDRVVLLGSIAAAALGITTLEGSPTVFVDGVPHTVIGIVDQVERMPQVLFSVIVPRGTAAEAWGDSPPNVEPKMLVSTRAGAAGVVADQLPVALRPEAPADYRVVPPPDPSTLRSQVTTDLTALFLVLAAVSLTIGSVGIANTMTVSILERVGEIGLRRAVGAARRHIALQFLFEGAVMGLGGGLVGTALAVTTVLAVALLRGWTAVLPPVLPLAAPLLGVVVGTLAAVYPAVRAAFIAPASALRT